MMMSLLLRHSAIFPLALSAKSISHFCRMFFPASQRIQRKDGRMGKGKMNIQSRFLVLVMEIERMTGSTAAREVFSLIGLGRSVKITCGLFYKMATSSLSKDFTERRMCFGSHVGPVCSSHCIMILWDSPPQSLATRTNMKEEEDVVRGKLRGRRTDTRMTERDFGSRRRRRRRRRLPNRIFSQPIQRPTVSFSDLDVHATWETACQA